MGSGVERRGRDGARRLHESHLYRIISHFLKGILSLIIIHGRNLDPHGGQQTSNKHTTPNGFLDLTGRIRSLKPLGAARIQGHIAVPVSNWVGGPGVPKSCASTNERGYRLTLTSSSSFKYLLRFTSPLVHLHLHSLISTRSSTASHLLYHSNQCRKTLRWRMLLRPLLSSPV